MSYKSTVYRILIASPSDVDEEREIVTRIIQEWNDLNSFNKKIVLLPIKWETHSSPTYGVRPQSAINAQLVDDCDLLVGFFWTKIGTPTGKEIGGTIEEIKRVSKAGKPVMLYFSKRGKDPSQINLSQLELLNKFKEEIYSTALVENYNSIVDFRDKLSRQLEMKIRELQDKKEDNKNLITFSFVDDSKGQFLENKQEISVERIVIEENELEKIKKTDSRIKKKQSNFHEELITYINRKNSVPIILGIKNNSGRVLNNSTTILKVTSSKEDALAIIPIYKSNDNSLDYKLNDFVFQKTESNIRNLFDNNHVKLASNIWEFKGNDFTLLPSKETILEPLILLYPKDSIKVEFKVYLFSDNLIQNIESSCELMFKYKKREITEKEISDIIKNLPDDDDLPF